MPQCCVTLIMYILLSLLFCSHTIGHVLALPTDWFYSHLYEDRYIYTEPEQQKVKYQNTLDDVKVYLTLALNNLENRNITIHIKNEEETSFNPTEMYKKNDGNMTPLGTNISNQTKDNLGDNDDSDQNDNRSNVNNQNGGNMRSNNNVNVTTTKNNNFLQLSNAYDTKLNFPTVNISDFEDTILSNDANNYSYNPNLRYLSTYKGISLEISCTQKYERFSMPGSCDQYIECRNKTAEILQCMDGLRYNPDANLGVSPCQDSIDVVCQKGDTTQKPIFSTIDCPNQFGIYKLEDTYNCSSYRICEFGVGYDYSCPDGLAFNSVNHRCDWPHNVPECDAEGYAGFRCPISDESVEKYSSGSSDCQVYYICTNNVPRRMKCGNFMAFHLEPKICVPADQVSSCPEKYRVAAAEEKKARIRNNRLYYETYFADRSGNINFFEFEERRPRIISNPHKTSS